METRIHFLETEGYKVLMPNKIDIENVLMQTSGMLQMGLKCQNRFLLFYE